MHRYRLHTAAPHCTHIVLGETLYWGLVCLQPHCKRGREMICMYRTDGFTLTHCAFTGKPAYEMLDSDPDWVPSLHLGHDERTSTQAKHLSPEERRRKRRAAEASGAPHTESEGGTRMKLHEMMELITVWVEPFCSSERLFSLYQLHVSPGS